MQTRTASSTINYRTAKQGFVVESRSELDDGGRPFPLLYMRLLARNQALSELEHTAAQIYPPRLVRRSRRVYDTVRRSVDPA